MVTAQMPLRDYLATWLESIRHRVRQKTYSDYETIIRLHISPALGHIKLNKLTPEHITRAWNGLLEQGASPHIALHAHRRLCTALNDAMKRQLIYRNPCQAVTPPRLPRREMDAPDAQSINRLLEEARGTAYYEALHTAFYTGLRRGELLALRWRDVDPERATLSVSRSVYRAKGGESVYNDTKTPRGRRMIDLPPESVLVLRALRERQEADSALLGYEVAEASPVFRYSNGDPILPRGFSGAFRKIMRRAGLEGYRLHDARHAHATLMLRQGIPHKVVMERLGHGRVGTTLDTYSHVSPGMQKAAALSFQEAIAEARPARVGGTPAR